MMTAKTLREVARTFHETTAGSIDGFHPRGLALMKAWRRWQLCYKRWKGLGLYPSQQMFLVVQMLPKPKGGFRPIVWFGAVARVWERARRREAAAWMASMTRPYWAFTAGAGAELTVWRQQIKA